MVRCDPLYPWTCKHMSKMFYNFLLKLTSQRYIQRQISPIFLPRAIQISSLIDAHLSVSPSAKTDGCSSGTECVFTDSNAWFQEEWSTSCIIYRFFFSKAQMGYFLSLLPVVKMSLSVEPGTFRFIQGNHSTVKLCSRLKNKALKR